MLKISVFSICFFAALLPIHADVYIYNTIDERMNYKISLPNGDSSDGSIQECQGYGPRQTTLRTERDKVTTLKVFSESGNTSTEVKAPDMRNYLVGKKDGKLQFRAVSWNTDDGQKHRAEVTLYNATGSVQTFDLVDEKQMRRITLQPGEETTVEAKNGFDGSFHHLKFPDGNRLDNAVRSGSYSILYLDSRSPGKVQAGDYGYVTPPRKVPK